MPTTPAIGHSKAVSSAVFGAFSIMLTQALTWFGLTVSPEFAQALTIVMATAATWLTPAKVTL